jgi:hypothetical protein
MTTRLYDGPNGVTILNGVDRIEFRPLETVERGANCDLRPAAEFTLALPPQRFVHALAVLERVRDQFTAQGLITPPALRRRATRRLHRQSRRIPRERDRRPATKRLLGLHKG